MDRLRNLDLTSPRSVEVEGLLTDLEELTAKNGNSFVRGMLKDGTISATFKHWDMTLADMYKKYGLSEKKSQVVQIKGQLDIYEGQPQVIVKGGLVSVTRQGAVDNYVETPPYPISTMLNAVKAAISMVKNEAISHILSVVMRDEKMAYIPYSCEVHTEKAGWLHHTYNCLGFKLTGIGEPKKAVVGEDGATSYIPLLDSDVIIGALFMHHLTPFTDLSVDPDTGAIEGKEVSVLLDGAAENIHLADSYLYPFIVEGDDAVRNLQHCIAAINGATEAKTPEAYYCVNLVNLELETYKAAMVKQGLTPGTAARFTLHSDNHTVVRM
jgi:hypothetical protein